jgi:hypothetical protein
MGVFRRHEPSPAEQRQKDKFVIRAANDGTVREECWFCGQEVEFDARNPTGEAAAVMIEPFGPGEPLHGVCHRGCADRAKGSLAF